MRRTKKAVYYVYEAEIRGKTVQRKTIKIANNTGGYHEEKAWFVVDGFYLASEIQLANYLGEKRNESDIDSSVSIR